MRSLPSHHASRALLVLALSCLPGLATAQDAVKGSLTRLTGLSDTAKLEYAEEVAAELTDAVKTVDRLFATAQKTGNDDTVKCVQDKLVALRSLAQVVDGANASLPGHIGSGATSQVDAEMRQVAVAQDRASGLMIEAQGCLSTDGEGEGIDELMVEGGEFDGSEYLDTEVPETMTWTDPPEASPYL